VGERPALLPRECRALRHLLPRLRPRGRRPCGRAGQWARGRATGAEIFGSAPLPAGGPCRYRDRPGALVDDVFTFFQGHTRTLGRTRSKYRAGNPFIARNPGGFFARGCRPANPANSRSARFSAGRDQTRRRRDDLIHARSERALAAANQQLRGAAGRRLGCSSTDVLG